MLRGSERPVRRSALQPRSLAALLGGAGAVAGLGYEGGAYGFSLRTQLAIVVWWLVALMAAGGFLRRPTRAALVVGGFLAAFTLWTGASILWAPSAEQVVLAFDRAGLYLGVYTLVVSWTNARRARSLSDGLAIGLVAVGVIALVSRLFPGSFGPQQLLQFLPGSEARLSFPVNYWNGLGILLALTFPLLLRAATSDDARPLRALALLPLPALGAAIYLTGSRGGIGSALAASVFFVALSARRWATLGAVVFAASGCVAAVGVLLPRRALLDHPFSDPHAAAQGHLAALWLVLVCVLTAAGFWVALWLVPSVPPRSRELGWALTTVSLGAAVLLVAAVHPIRRFQDFKEPRLALASSSAIQQHVLGGGGTGRWQLWSAAVAEFRTRPIEGRGAGTYGPWWLEHGSLPIFVQTAHSLYLQTLGELGLVGLALLVASLGGGVVAGGQMLRRLPTAIRVDAAAFFAGFGGWVLACAVDWVWELTIVGLVGVVLLGLLVSARAGDRPDDAPPSHGVVSRRHVPGRFGIAAVALVMMVANALPFVAQRRIDASQSAARSGDLALARQRADSARALEPWAASPYVQLALVGELSGELRQAKREIDRALAREPTDWRLWLVRARIAVKSGHVRDANRSLRNIRRLNPRSALFH